MIVSMGFSVTYSQLQFRHSFLKYNQIISRVSNLTVSHSLLDVFLCFIQELHISFEHVFDNWSDINEKINVSINRSVFKFSVGR